MRGGCRGAAGLPVRGCLWAERRDWAHGVSLWKQGAGCRPSRLRSRPGKTLRPGPDPPLPQHKICTPLTLEMYYTEMDPERHRSILAAIGAYPLSRKHGTETPSAWGEGYRAVKEGPKAPTQAGAAAAATEPPGKSSALGEKEAARKAAGSAPPPAPQ